VSEQRAHRSAPVQVKGRISDMLRRERVGERVSLYCWLVEGKERGE